MSTSTEQAVDSIVSLVPEPDGHEIVGLQAVQSDPEPAAVAGTTPEASEKVHRERRWLLPVAIGAAGLIVSGTLGGLLFSTVGQRDAARVKLATTQTTLLHTRSQLTAANAEAATKKVSSDYVRLVAVDSGQATADYGSIAVCSSFTECRTAAQQTLTDLQGFQTARATATVPADLGNTDGALRDALSSAIAAMQEVIAGADNNDDAKLKDGADKMNAAVLAIGKAEAGLKAAVS